MRAHVFQRFLRLFLLLLDSQRRKGLIQALNVEHIIFIFSERLSSLSRLDDIFPKTSLLFGSW